MAGRLGFCVFGFMMLAGVASAGLPALAARTLPAGTVIASGDIAGLPAEGLGEGPPDLSAVVGQQVRTTVYEGRPIEPANLVRPILVERNAQVLVTYTAGSLSISTEGRALGRGAAGDTVPVLNIASRVTLSARINPDGTLSVVNRQ